ncbi:MAG: hypothetical protein H6737_06890 [Alphaproteobacteria bacterium]|nr:hypothetical protein [Alphaproteobacteria bacterium]
MVTNPVVRIDPRASRYLELLVEFGHLDAHSAEDILFSAADAWAGTNRPIPLDAIQRLAAEHLVRWDAPVDDGTDILSADWPLLFY